MTRPFQICSRCVMDTSVSSIRFNENGVCNFCESHDRLAAAYSDPIQVQKNLEKLIEKIKSDGKNKPYDCIIGVSGGTDSSYTLYQAKLLGLRPLAVHFDNGWNTDQAVTNIRQITNALDVDLHTHVVNWEEFKDLQISFLKAAVPCIEAPTDVGIHGILYKTAAQEGVKTILGGQSFRTEGTVPREWSYLDGTYVSSVHKLYGSKPLKTFTNLSLNAIFYYTFIKNIRQVPFLNFFNYDKKTAKLLLKEKFGWQDYDGHHYENIYSKFAFGWYLPKKFKIDKRKVSLSGPVRSKLMSREDALETLKSPPPITPDFVEYCFQKLELNASEIKKIIESPSKTYRDYFSSESLIKHLRIPVKMAVKMGFFTPVLYEKYFK